MAEQHTQRSEKPRSIVSMRVQIPPVALVGKRGDRTSGERVSASWNALNRLWHEQITIETVDPSEETLRGRAPAPLQLTQVGEGLGKARR